MPHLSFVTLDVFGLWFPEAEELLQKYIRTVFGTVLTAFVTRTKFKGNPLALVFIPAGQNPATETLQTIAREFNLSETAFLYLNNNDACNDNDNDSSSSHGSSTSTSTSAAPASWRARIFMVDAELPFAGHPTIGTVCFALGSLAKNASQSQSQGTLRIPAGEVSAWFANGVATAAIPHSVRLHVQNPFTRQDVEALQPRLQGWKLRGIDVVSPVRGMNFVCVELDGLEALGRVECTGKRPGAKMLDEGWDVGFVGALFYVWMGGEEGGGKVRLRTRMIEGVMEDPATGSASCALSALLSLKSRVKKVAYELTQGVEMGRQSEIGIAVTLDDALEGVERLEMSGSSVKVMEGTVEYE